MLTTQPHSNVADHGTAAEDPTPFTGAVHCPPEGQYLRSKKKTTEKGSKSSSKAPRSHLTKTQLRRANLKRFSNAEEKIPQRNETCIYILNSYLPSTKRIKEPPTKTQSRTEDKISQGTPRKSFISKKALHRQEEP